MNLLSNTGLSAYFHNPLIHNEPNQLFTMFKRFHTHVEGAGVALYMIRKMVENPGGNIEVESREGEGTIFRMKFPH